MCSFIRFERLASFRCLACCLHIAMFTWLVTPHFELLADGPADNIPTNVRRIPKDGIQIPDEVREELQIKLGAFEQFIQKLREQKPEIHPYLPDVLIYHKAVQDALSYEEFFDAKEIAVARELINEGQARGAALLLGETPWLTKPGPTVRGYISKIDGSVQPYGLVIPAGYEPQGKAIAPAKAYRLDFWFHGRGETLSELNFLNDRRKNPGQFTPPDTFVLHPYGRYCNANKFAGEIDGLEALEAVRANFSIDENRMNVRGFSMGGAACWQFATHYSDRWCSAAPGAGFAETPQFLKVFQKEELKPTWWEQKLWRMYDCNGWVGNLQYLPTVAYSGEKDVQKQAADIMVEAASKEGFSIPHIIGPNTAHAYEAKAKEDINRLIDGFNEKGRNPYPDKIRLVTYSLRYNKMHWLEIDGLEQHWERAEVIGERNWHEKTTQLKTKNVTDLTLHFPQRDLIMMMISLPLQQIMIDGQPFEQGESAVRGDFKLSFHREGETWKKGARPALPLRKSSGLQGPIDDAFMDSFVFVRPSGEVKNEKTNQWAIEELDRAIQHWRRQFRGEPRAMMDKDITEEQIAASNLVLWGDPQSNTFLSKIIDKLPIAWNNERIQVGEKSFPATNHALIAVYPNPLNPKRYVVLNSSFTYRDFAYLNNARQVPMLPDWAIVNVDTPPNAVWPGKVVEANFFGEKWELK
jgi:Prolyl oligopeptidase family